MEIREGFPHTQSFSFRQNNEYLSGPWKPDIFQATCKIGIRDAQCLEKWGVFGYYTLWGAAPCFMKKWAMNIGARGVEVQQVGWEEWGNLLGVSGSSSLEGT